MDTFFGDGGWRIDLMSVLAAKHALALTHPDLREATWQRLLAEAHDEEARVGPVEATIAAVEEAGAAGALDYEGKRQSLSDLGVMVFVYTSWHDSPYRWVMTAFEERDGNRRLC